MTTVLVGYAADQAGAEALVLGRLLTGQGTGQLIVCTIVPEVWNHPTLSAVDQEYANYLDEHAQETLASAWSLLEGMEGVPPIQVQYLKHAAKSTTVGLSEAAAQAGADVLVVGSARAGVSGRLSLGSVSSEILHSSGLAVALAPQGYDLAPGQRVTRLSCAYAGTEVSNSTVLEALRLAGSLGVPLRVVAFAVRDRQMYPSLAGYKAENMIVDAWRERTKAALERLQEQLAGHSPPISVALADGESWEEALGQVDWHPGEVLALGSSRMGVLARVFLGSNASKIIRASPVPVLVLPKVG
ncbi:universal stress protein [Deinococcus sp. Arct2-2]|uniref:universal stress protein n=1 Tax=Deinococcus sp. Arct2-2 TaxID=2568653 RepID=UPI0010A3C0DA|nr:universal stress protein [Deinococcus sp. Arct2-2]THF70693.1 universal stress protein [Deinococcus sp. Arct2-2]